MAFKSEWIVKCATEITLSQTDMEIRKLGKDFPGGV